MVERIAKIQKFVFHSKENDWQNEWAAYKMGENLNQHLSDRGLYIYPEYIKNSKNYKRTNNLINKQMNDLNRHSTKKLKMTNKYIKAILNVFSHGANTNQNHTEILLSPSGWPSPGKQYRFINM